MRRFALALPLILLAAQGALGQTDQESPNPAPHFEVQPAAASIVVDGQLDDAAWENATRIPLLYEWLPGDNISPPVETTFLITFDSDNLYVGVDAQDPEPGKIRAHFTNRDDIQTFSKNDSVTIIIDTFNDQRQAYEFRVNPVGAQMDGVFDEVQGGNEDFSWDAVWDSAAQITQQGYAVEMAIPLQQLRFPHSTDHQTWGVSMGRDYPRSLRHRMSSHRRDRDISCLLCQMNKVTGFEQLESGHNLEINPTVTLTRTDARESFPDGKFVKQEEDAQPGLDLRWGITSDATLRAALNPDFSQVESDVAQLAVNEQFALFFPEQRPFFLEAADFFETPLQAVFTRTIVDPDWGGKLTGKAHGNTYGLFVAHDEVNSLLIPSNQGTASSLLDGTVDTGVARYRRDVLKDSAVGLLYTGREGDAYHNRVAGVDGYFRLSKADDLRVQYLRSDTLYPEHVGNQFDQPSDAFQGDALTVQYNHLSRNWFGVVEYHDLDPMFRADSGFIPRVDYRTHTLFFGRQLWGDQDNWYTDWVIGGFYSHTDDYSGQSTDQTTSVLTRIRGPLQSSLQVTLQFNQQYFGGVFYDELNRLFFDVRVQPSGSFALIVLGLFGDTIDFTNNQRADLVELKPMIDFKLGRSITGTLNHTYRALNVAGGDLVDANLTELRLYYHFSVRSFIRTIFQYSHIKRDPEQFLEPVDRTSEDLATQLLFSYQLNSRTVLYTGYQDQRLGSDQINLTQNDRTYYVKLGYALLY